MEELKKKGTYAGIDNETAITIEEPPTKFRRQLLVGVHFDPECFQDLVVFWVIGRVFLPE